MAESLWEEHEPYADPDFSTKIAEDFQARYWEMFLTASLLRAGCTVIKKVDPEGPDIHIKYGNKCCFPMENMGSTDSRNIPRR